MAVQRVIAVLALQVVIAVAAIESVILRTATDEVISVFTVELVFTGPTVQGVIACTGIHGVVTGQTREGVGGGVAVQRVVLAGGGKHTGLDGIDVPDGAVGELDLFDLVAVGGIVVEVAVDAQRVSGAVDRQHEIVALTLERHTRSGNACAQLDCVELARRAVVGADGVLARSLAKQVGVVACPPVERIVAEAAVQRVVTGIPIDGVVVQTTRERFIGCSTVDRNVGWRRRR